MNKRALFKIAACILFFTAFIMAPADAGPSSTQAGCITSNCHSEIDQYKYVHGPVAVGECLICHGSLTGHSKNPEKSRYKLILNVTRKCYICHERSHNKPAGIKGKKCTQCHDPHGASKPLLLEK